MFSEIRNFLTRKGFPKNSWFQDEKLKVYLRKNATRYINGTPYTFVDLATIEVHDKGKGEFNNFLKQLENLVEEQGNDGLFIENVMDDGFRAAILKKGYVLANDEESVYKLFNENLHKKQRVEEEGNPLCNII
jgi:hypothetical protein